MLKSAPLAAGLNSLAASITEFGYAAERFGKFWSAMNDNPKGTILDAWGKSGEGQSFGSTFAKYKAPRAAAFVRQDQSLYADVGTGVAGGISPGGVPAFARMQASPTVDTSQLDATKAKADEAHTAVEGLNVTATPAVNSSSIDAAIAKARELKTLLDSIGGAANSAVSGVSRAAAQIKSLGSVQQGNYVHGGVQGAIDGRVSQQEKTTTFAVDATRWLGKSGVI